MKPRPMSSCFNYLIFSHICRDCLVVSLGGGHYRGRDCLQLEPAATVEDEPEDDDGDHGDGDAVQPFGPETDTYNL